MDVIEARLECLKLASGLNDGKNNAAAIVADAKVMVELVLPPIKESKNTGQRGADDPK